MPRKQKVRRPGALTDLQPGRILTQIALLQIAYYASAAILLVFTALVAGRPVSVGLLFSWRKLRGDTTVGWMFGFVWMLNSLVTVVPILLLIARSKLVLDFAVTIHFLHLVVTTLYTKSLPASWLWWALQAASAACMTSLGIWACQWRELQPIDFGARSLIAASVTQDSTAASSEDGDGHARGRGRGRGRDGGGTYEMVGTSENAETIV